MWDMTSGSWCDENFEREVSALGNYNMKDNMIA